MRWLERRKEKKQLRKMVKHCLIVPNINNAEILARWGYVFRKVKVARIKPESNQIKR